jgi:hypothetical protein
MTTLQEKAKAVREHYNLVKSSQLSPQHTLILLHTFETNEGVTIMDHIKIGLPSHRSLAADLSRLKSFGYLYAVESKKFKNVYKLSTLGETYIRKLLK